MGADDLTPFDSERGRDAGRRSGKARKQLKLADVEQAFGSLDSVDDAMRRLDRLSVWLAAGLVHGAQGSAAVRAVECWVKAHESKLSAEIVGQLRERLEALEQDVKRSGLRVMP